MKGLLILAAILLAVSRIPSNVAGGPRGATTFTVFLSGTNEVPPNGSLVVGQGWVTLDGKVINFAFGSFRYPFSPTFAGIYGPARPGENGPPIVGDLASAIFPPEGLVYGGGWELTRAQIGQLKAGLLYVNIKSVQFPDGEIRGQILPDRAEPAATSPVVAQVSQMLHSWPTSRGSQGRSSLRSAIVSRRPGVAAPVSREVQHAYLVRC